jgi:peroxiredoxin family protein
MTIILLSGAFVLAAFAVITANGKTATGWAILLLSMALLFPRLG